MREDSMAVLVIKRLSMEWGKMGWERAFGGLNGAVRTEFAEENPNYTNGQRNT